MSTDTTPRPDPGRRHDATAMTATARGKRTPTELDSGDAPELSRGLENRHLQLIAIGGAIGTGLFLGSGRTISLAGPSILLVYLIIGFFLFFVMRAMGELLLSNLEYKSFADFAGDILGPWASYFVGWTYWFCWIATAIADTTAIAKYIQYWWPDTSSWIPAVGLVALLFLLNLPSVKAFGELEFWFALIKVLAIITLIVVGLYMIFTGSSHGGQKSSFSNLWSHGGIFPMGFMGFAAGFQIAVFAFVGVELVGTAAAETKDPEKNLPRAVNSVPIRMLLFYVGALVILMSVRPWTEFKAGESPFVKMFALAGLAAAAAFGGTDAAGLKANPRFSDMERWADGWPVKRLVVETPRPPAAQPAAAPTPATTGTRPKPAASRRP